MRRAVEPTLTAWEVPGGWAAAVICVHESTGVAVFASLGPTSAEIAADRVAQAHGRLDRRNCAAAWVDWSAAPVEGRPPRDWCTPPRREGADRW